MPLLRRETRRFRRRAINSLILAIELFNRPQEIGRTEAVLPLLQRTFEMLLKAAIYERRGTIYPRRERISYTFKQCLGIARSDIGILNEEQALSLAILGSLRDCVAHNLLDLTEQALYVHAQAAVTLFDQVLISAFHERLADHLPTRVLPISTDPPRDMLVFMDTEFSQIHGLLAPGKRRKAEARGRLRHLMIMESNIAGEGEQPTDQEIDRMSRRVKQGETWQTLFPGVASLRLDTQGHGPTVSIRFTRETGAAPTRLIREGELGAEETAPIREVDMLQRYPMGLKGLARNLGLTEPRTLALVRYLDLQSDDACFREFHPGTFANKRYSPEALRRLREALPDVDINAVWRIHGSARRPAKT